MSQPASIDPQARMRGEVIPERNRIVPPWAPPIHDFDVIVRDEKGEEIPPGFTIGDVAPEYRWAIDPDTGCIMDPFQFKDRYEAWYALHYTMQSPPSKVEGEILSIPSVEDFVSQRVHPEDITKTIPMATDLNRPVVSKPKELVDRDGENPIPREQALAQQQANESGAKMQLLVKMHNAGKLTDAEFAEESKAIYGGSVVVGDGQAGTPEPAAAEPSKPPPEGFQTKDTPVEMTTAPCGKEVTARGVHIHKVNCKACKAIKENAIATGQAGEKVPSKEE